jgi:hypothetical protein
VREFAVYTVARIGIFVGSYVVVAGVYLLVTGSGKLPLLWPLLVAAVLSAVASYFLLKGPRERFAQRVESRAQAASRRFEEARAKEDTD